MLYLHEKFKVNGEEIMKLEEEIHQKSFSNEYHKAIVNLIYTYNWVTEHQEKLFKPYNITSQQYNVLRILRGQYPKPATIKLIRERMLDKMSDASRIVEKLRVKGLVERTTCPSDRRNVDVVITREGLEILAGIDKYNHIMEERMSSLNEEEIRCLNDLLDKLRG